MLTALRNFSASLRYLPGAIDYRAIESAYAVRKVWASVGRVLRQRGVVYDVGRAMGALAVNWRPDYSPALMRRELDIIRTDLHANAVRLGGRDPRRLLAAAEYAASIGLDVWLGPELWNATPKRTLRYITEVAAAAEPLFRRWPDRLTFCVGNELSLFMRGIVPGRSHARRSRSPVLRDIVLSGQHALRSFLADAAASVRRVYGGPSFSFPLAPYSEDPRHDIDATALSIVRTLPRGQHGTTYPDVGWQPKAAFHALAGYYRQQVSG
jgi:hypothetical protein